MFQVHFESAQFEQNRLDGWRKLKPNAVPILFEVPNPKALIKEIKLQSTVLSYIFFLYSQYFINFQLHEKLSGFPVYNISL